jgi:hypothetical protein
MRSESTGSPGVQHREVHPHRQVKVGERAAAFRGTLAEIRQDPVQRAPARDVRGEAVGDLPGQRLRPGAVAGEVHGDGIAQVAVTLFGEHEADGVLLAAVLVLRFLAVQQVAHDARIGLEALQGHGLPAQQAHGGVAGAHGHEAAARGDHVEGGHAGGQRGREAQSGYRDAHAELHGPGLARGDGQEDEGVGADEAAVGDPQVREAQLLRLVTYSISSSLAQ